MYGTRCADPFQTFGPVSCVCEPFTCNTLLACNLQTEDGCGGTLYCGKCADNSVCNQANHSCCPPGDMSDGEGGCVCAPPKPCGSGFYWNWITCTCEAQMFAPGKGGVPPAK
jgi:hypothetical protein